MSDIAIRASRLDEWLHYYVLSLLIVIEGITVALISQIFMRYVHQVVLLLHCHLRV